MIFIGLDANQKRAEISRYVAANGISKLVVISADEFPLPVEGADQIKYSDVIMYVTFYRLLQQIDKQTLVVLNECLRTQNRYDLAYNCIRNYLNQTDHQLIFQLLPQIDTHDDFMVLFDWDTKSRWKRRGFDPYLVQGEASVKISPLSIGFSRISVPTSEKTRQKYAQEREKLFNSLGNRDPHIIPRNLYLIGGPDKLAYIAAQDMPIFAQSAGLYVARNQRLGHKNIVTYADVVAGQHYTVVELPHRFIDYGDFVQATGQAQSSVLVSDLKIDEWYFTRYQQWSERIHDTYSSLS